MTPNPLQAPFSATADQAAQARPDADPDMIREVFTEAATMLHDGLALDGLDEHDVTVVVRGLCVALVAQDPGAAIRACSEAAVDDLDVHDPQGVSASYLTAAAILRV